MMSNNVIIMVLKHKLQMLNIQLKRLYVIKH